MSSHFKNILSFSGNRRRSTKNEDSKAIVTNDCSLGIITVNQGTENGCCADSLPPVSCDDYNEYEIHITSKPGPAGSDGPVGPQGVPGPTGPPV